MITIIAYGTPAPQGSKKFMGIHGGHAVLKESSAKVLPWRQNVETAAREVMEYGEIPALDGPLVARMVFTMPKPTSAPKTRKSYPDRKPDLSKLCRSTEDALKTGGAWADDARVVEYWRLVKVFPGEDPESLQLPGVRVEIYTMAEYLALCAGSTTARADMRPGPALELFSGGAR